MDPVFGGNAAQCMYHDFNQSKQYKAITELFNPHYNPLLSRYYDFHFIDKEIEAQRG